MLRSVCSLAIPAIAQRKAAPISATNSSFAVYQFVKQGAVVVRSIQEAAPRWHVDGISAWPVVSAVLGAAIEIERGAVLPSGDNALAKFVFVDLR